MEPLVTSPTQNVSKLGVWLPRVAVLMVIFAGVVLAARAGVRFRQWTWDVTVPIRYVDDIDRDFYWGRRSASEGYLNQYEKMQVQKPGDDVWLDYSPLRLGVMTLWGRWAIRHFPDVKAWHTDHSYALTAPLLHFNLLMEAVGAVSAFLLTRLICSRRPWGRGSVLAAVSASFPTNLSAIRDKPPLTDRASLRWFFRGCLPGLIAAAILWFNPAIVLSAYGWPAWDLWIIPPFLLAALLASLDWWFAAGVVIGIGAMLKGQQLISLPVFAIWSLVLWRPLATLRFCSGAVIAIAVVVSPWMVTFIPAAALAHARAIQSLHAEAYLAPDGLFRIARKVDLPALFWIAGVLLAAIAGPFVSRLTLEKPAGAPVPRWRHVPASPWAWRALAAFATVALVVWPWLPARNRNDWWIGLLAAAALAAIVQVIRPRGIAYVAAGAVGTALLLCMPLFHGSAAWFDCCVHFSAIHRPRLYLGLADNLPAILNEDFHWPIDDLTSVLFTVPANALWWSAIDVTVGTLLQGIFWITLLLCAIGIGIHARRRERRVLIALVAPWLMLFCFPPDIRERYLLFAAGLSCLCAGVSLGMTLLGMFLSVVTFIMMLDAMIARPGSHRRELGPLLAGQFPGLFSSGAGETLLRVLNGTYPDLGYAVILCALVFLYFSLAPCRRPLAPGRAGVDPGGAGS